MRPGKSAISLISVALFVFVSSGKSKRLGEIILGNFRSRILSLIATTVTPGYKTLSSFETRWGNSVKLNTKLYYVFATKNTAMLSLTIIIADHSSPIVYSY